MSYFNKSIIQGTNDDGTPRNLSSTGEGHLEVAIHSPILPFGSINSESLIPVIQSDGVYGINVYSMTYSTGLAFGTGANSANVTSTGNKLVVSTGNTQYSFASLQSRRRLRYKAGQGVVGRFAGFFTGATNSCYLVAGFGTAETTLGFGYYGPTFSILYSTGGVREIHTLTISTASTSTNPYMVTMPNGVTVSVNATNNASTTGTAYEVSNGTFTGWKARSTGSTVMFLSDSSGPKTGTFSISQPGAVTPAGGLSVETLSGVTSTDNWIPQSSWNGDKLDGTGPSGVVIDPTKGNIYQIGIQYLGFGTLAFDVEVVPPNSNNATFVRVHTIRYPNSSTEISLSQPSFPFLMTAYSAGSTSTASVSIGSFAGFNAGVISNLGPRLSYDRDTVVTSSTTVFKPIMTIRNGQVFNNRSNQSVIHLLNISGSAKGNASAQTKFYLVRNAVLTGPVNFTSPGSKSSAVWDVSATGMVDPPQDQRIWSTPIIESGMFDHEFGDKEITLQPGESVTVCVKAVAATADCIAVLDTREAQ